MKIVIDIPDSIIPAEIKALINSGDITEEQQRDIVEALLRLTGDVFDECRIEATEYRLVLK